MEDFNWRQCGILLLLVCILNSAYALECYKCNTTVSTMEDDSCEGKGKIVTCVDPAVCLSATYSLQEGGSMKKEYTTLKTCYPKMQGDECTYLLKNIKNMNPMSTKVEFTGKCYICEEKGCNEHSGASSYVTVSVIFVSTIGYIVSKLF